MPVSEGQKAFVGRVSDYINNNRGALNDQDIADALFTGALSYLVGAGITADERDRYLARWVAFIMIKRGET